MGKITLSDLDAPEIVLESTYFWSPSKNSSGRRYSEKKHLEEVFNWLEIINNKYGLELNISIVGNYVYAHDGKEVSYFHYRETCGNAYKKQNFKELLKIVQKKLEKKDN